MNPAVLTALTAEIAALTITKAALTEKNAILAEAWNQNKEVIEAADASIKSLEAEIQSERNKKVLADFEAWPQFVCMGTLDRRSRWLTEEERCAICRFCRTGINPLAIAMKFSLKTLQTVDRYANYCS